MAPKITLYEWCMKNNRKDLLDEFDYTQNAFSPKTISFCSGKKLFWKCEKGHAYVATLSHRTSRNSGCPFCSGHKVLKGFNDIVTTHPDLIKEWDYEKNVISPYDYSKGSIVSVWWKCEKGHSFKQTINSRTNAKTGCPYCSNKKLLVGFNDLKTRFPNVSSEWDYNKNSPITPENVFPGTTKKFWWICPYGHKYLASPNKRTSNDATSCPICDKEKKISIPEKIAFYCIKQVLPNAEDNYHPNWKSKKNLDIYIPDYNVGIEYDGNHWHQNKIKDFEKNNLCKENDIKLIRIREKGCPILNDYSIDFYTEPDDLTSLVNTINRILKDYFNITKEVLFDYTKDIALINKLVSSSFKSDNILLKYPKESMNWDYEKNGELRPSFFTGGSGKKVWWKCEKGHSYLASIYNHCTLKHACPYCSGNLVDTGKNDLTHTHPEILKYWDYSKNTISPSDVMPGSGKKAFWKCEKGHEFIRPIRDMVSLNRCIICNKFGNRRTTGKAVVCYDLNLNCIKEYESAAAAARDLNVHPSAISMCCNEKRKKAYGYIWKYKNK